MTAVCNNTLEGTMPKQEVDYGAMDVDTAINPEAEETTPKTRRTRTTTYGMLLLFVMRIVLVVAGAGVGVPRSFLRYDTIASIVETSTSDRDSNTPIELICGQTETVCDERDSSCHKKRCCCDNSCPAGLDTKYHNPPDKHAYCDTDKGYQTCWDFLCRKCYCQTETTGKYQEAAKPCKFMKVGPCKNCADGQTCCRGGEFDFKCPGCGVCKNCDDGQTCCRGGAFDFKCPGCGNGRI